MNKEAVILKAAEEVFLEKGYAAGRTVEIAQRAGVTHAMLHYYFKTKENLFARVFSEKLELFSSGLSASIDERESLLEVVMKFMSRHYDFMAQNPELPRFVINEISHNEMGRRLCREIAFPKIRRILVKLRRVLRREIAAGKIRYISTWDFFFDIVAINAVSFVAQPMMSLMFRDDQQRMNLFIQHRKQENIELVLSRLRPQ